MKIIGLQGLDDPQSIRAEVERGGRFVVYLYCVSIILMTFKRTSDIHFIRPGQSAVVRGLPCTLISFFLGWWGFPWGLVYTVEALVKNLGGGTDVTQAVLAQIDPPPLGAATAEADSLQPAASLPPAMPLRAGEHSRSAPSAAVGAFRLALIVLALIGAGWIGIALYRGADVPAAVVNGLSAPLTVVIDDDAPLTLAPNASLRITLAEGEHRFVWTRPDGRKEEGVFSLNTPFWSRPLDRRVAVLNPDRVALVYHETTRYFPKDQPIPEGQNDYVLHAGQAFRLFPAADYFFEDFPASISLPNREVKTKTRHAHADYMAPGQRVFALDGAGRTDDARALALRFSELHPDDEVFLQIALSKLPDEDIDAFFSAHLGDSPLRLEWHRAYQHHVEHRQPGRDLLPRYRELAAKHPDDGAAAYLVARIETDPKARHAFLNQAIAAAHPCAYAHNSLAYEALGNARFAEALAYLRAAEAAGLQTLAFRQTQYHILLANGLVDEALSQIRAVRAKDPHPLAATNRPYLNLEIAISSRAQPSDREAEAALVKPYLDSIKPLATTEQQAAIAKTLAALAAYGRGDEEGFAARLAGIDDFGFAVAITRGRAADAAKALAGQPRTTGYHWLLVYLAAREAGEKAAADEAFEKALAAFAGESREHRAVLAHLREGDASPEKICAELLPLDDKCVLATALGHRFPAHRAAYHAFAAKLNFKPDFPALFLARQLKPEHAPGMANSSL